MNTCTLGIAQDLEALLQEHLKEGESEETLQRAYELGRRALAGGVGILGMIALHQGLVRRIVQEEGASGAKLERLAAAQVLFLEVLSPYEMTHRTTREASAAWRQLNQRLEAEAKRIAHALHDEAGQMLVMAHIALSELAEEIEPEHRHHLEQARNILDQIEDELRRLSHELRPTILDDLGLVPALQFLAEGVSRRGNLTIDVQNHLEGRLPPEFESTLYRIVQEALSNVSRHAQARKAAIRIRRKGGQVACEVRDDGIGFCTGEVLAPGARTGLGLLGIEERLAPLGGTLTVKTSPGRGTELSVLIPLEEKYVAAHPARR
jgi:signal transduction histidine kinase